MKVIAIIPVYNEALTITNIVKETQKYCDEVIVVDDCSNDQTAEVARNLGIRYTRHSTNQGQGAATKTGIGIARLYKADVIVTLDGDGQHDPNQIPLLLELLRNRDDIDIVIGSRFMGVSSTPLYRRFGLWLLTWLYNIGSKRKVSDAFMCLRAFRHKVFDKVSIEENGFGFCPEMLIKARYEGFKIVEVPVGCFYHKEYKRNSTLNPIQLATILAWKIILWRVKIEH